MSETVEVKVQLDKKVYDALEWYVRNTGFWAGNNLKDQAISSWIACTVKDDLASEATGGAPTASDFLADELKIMLGIQD